MINKQMLQFNKFTVKLVNRLCLITKLYFNAKNAKLQLFSFGMEA